MFTPWFERLADITNINSLIIARIAATLVAFIAYGFIRRAIIRFFANHTANPNQKYQLQKTVEAIWNLTVVVILWQIWLPSLDSLATYFGLLSAGIAIALKDPIANLFGWLFVIWRRPFEVGDRIQIGEIIGDVIDQRVFSFLLIEVGNWVDADQSTGRVIFIPNSKIFSEPLFSYTTGVGGYIWNEIPVLLTFESDWRAAKEKFQALLDQELEENPVNIQELKRRQQTEKFLLLMPATTPIVYTSVKDSGILLTMRFLCKPRQRRIIAEEMWESVLAIISSSDDIDLAYPTQRIVINQQRVNK